MYSGIHCTIHFIQGTMFNWSACRYTARSVPSLQYYKQTDQKENKLFSVCRNLFTARASEENFCKSNLFNLGHFQQTEIK